MTVIMANITPDDRDNKRRTSDNVPLVLNFAKYSRSLLRIKIDFKSAKSGLRAQQH